MSVRLPHEYPGIDPRVRCESVDLPTAPGRGILHLPERGEPEVALLAMHPRTDFSRHYLAPALVAGGYAFLGMPSRYLNNDADALHERLLLDVGACVALLRARGVRRVILLGNSGGASLFAFYLAQAVLAPAERLVRAPSGDRVALGEAELPMADGLVLLAAHLGEGVFLLDRLDPSVVDETDPTAVDPDLDMYDPRNGYRPMRTGQSRYAPDFLERFRAGQRARCARIDAQALAWCEEAAAARGALREAGPGADPSERARLVRGAALRRHLLVYRTLADPRYLDLTLDPSERAMGSIFSFGRDPIVGNYGDGIGRVMSARGWLSTWSGLHSNAALEKTLPAVRVPTLMLTPRADTDIHPAECRRAYAALAADDREHVELSGADHYLRPAGPEATPDDDPRERAARGVLLPWLRARWPVAGR